MKKIHGNFSFEEINVKVYEILLTSISLHGEGEFFPQPFPSCRKAKLLKWSETGDHLDNYSQAR